MREYKVVRATTNGNERKVRHARLPPAQDAHTCGKRHRTNTPRSCPGTQANGLRCGANGGMPYEPSGLRRRDNRLCMAAPPRFLWLVHQPHETVCRSILEVAQVTGRRRRRPLHRYRAIEDEI